MNTNKKKMTKKYLRIDIYNTFTRKLDRVVDWVGRELVEGVIGNWESCDWILFAVV